MDNNELMLKVENVSKVYKLGEIGGTTLRDEFQRLKAKIFHKEDPTKKIGSKVYNKGERFKALDNISFEVKKGERIGIIGHNGAGKSTLLKLISRVTGPTEGKIYLNGRVASMLEVGTGFHPELTGRENIYMNGAILGMTKKEIDAKMEDIIEFSEVRQFIDTPVKRYSSGMYVKLAFSVAAHLDSEIMIMDEVLAVGDMAFQGKCLKKMKQISENDLRTILYVSHNMNTIRQLCNRVIVLDSGKIVYDGEVEKGIAIYSGINFVENTYFDLHLAEKNTDTDSAIDMISLKLNRNSNIFNTRENVDFTLEFESPFDEVLKDIKLVVVVLRTDEVRIGMTESDIFTISKGKQTIRGIFNIGDLIDGNYFAEISIVKNLPDGTFHKYAGIYNALPFTVVNDKIRLHREWKQAIYGNVTFPIIKVLN